MLTEPLQNHTTDSDIAWGTETLAGVSTQVTDGSHFSPKPQVRGFPIANVKDLRPGFVDISSCTKIKVEDFQALVRNGCDVRGGNVLLSKDGTVGKVVVYRQPDHLVALSSIAIIRPSARVDSGFLGHVLQSNDLARQYGVFTGGSALRRLVLTDINRLVVPVPPLKEQIGIAAVLDTVDEAIAKTEALIAKLRKVRAGLIHDLLTRGLDHNGQLRDPIAHPEQFKICPLGQIPQEWTVAPLRHFLASAEYGISTSLSIEGSLPVLRMNNLSGGEACLEDMKFATCDVPASLLLRVGDVLFNRTNSYDHVGRTGIWRGQMPIATFASYLVRLNPAAGRLTAEFLNLALNMPESQQRMRRYATPAVQQVNINPTQLQYMLLAAPQFVTEQKQIAAFANESAGPLAAENSELVKLLALRSGLMTDLLTGRACIPDTMGATP